MKTIKLVILTVFLASALLCFSSSARAGIITLNFGSLPGSSIQFNGTDSSFTFNPTAGAQWWITGIEGGIGDSLSLKGMFSDGPWFYGPITVDGSNQSAPVISRPGTFTVYDGSGGQVTGTVAWVEVSTHQYAGGINSNALINLYNMSYTPGSIPVSDLRDLVFEGFGSVNLTFQFNPGMTLTQLTSGRGPYRTSFSGSISADPVPEPSLMLLLGIGVGFAPLAARRKKN
jgi:hypothetical protein